MTPSEFANKIRTKYPGAYDNMADEELARKVITKFPVYGSQVNFEASKPQDFVSRAGEQIKKAGEEVYSKIAGEGDNADKSAIRRGTEATAVAFTAPLKVGYEALPEVTRQGLSDLGTKIGEKFTKVADIVSKVPGLQDWVMNNPESAKKLEEVLGTTVAGGEIAGDILAYGQMASGAQKGVDKTKQAVTAVKEQTPKIVESGITKIKGGVKDTGLKLKEKVTGVSEKTGIEKLDEDVFKITREPITPEYEARAAQEGRMYTEGRTKKVQIKPSRREQLVSDSVRSLVEDGRLDPNKLPFENIQPIQQEVSRINQGVEQMIYERKIPFNMNQLKSKLTKVKADSDIVFTTDPTLERTYDALINAFMENVSKGDTLGVFKARQSFDKIPAVKKLLDGLKGATGENLRRQAVLDIRRAANEYVSDLLPENNPYRYALMQESYMLEAIGNLAERSKGLMGSTVISRTIAEYPSLKFIIRQAIPFGAGGMVF